MTHEKYGPIIEEMLKTASEGPLGLERIPRRIAKLERTVSPSDPPLIRESQDFGYSDEEYFNQILSNKLEGYRASIWTRKLNENKIAWANNSNLPQTGTFYRSKVIYDSLAFENGDDEIFVFENDLKEVNPSSKPSYIGRNFVDVMKDLKSNATLKMEEFIREYESKRNEKNKKIILHSIPDWIKEEYIHKEMELKDLTKDKIPRKIAF